VVLEENAVVTYREVQLQALYEQCEVNPYDFDDLTLRLERASAADVAKYRDDDDC
jgi:hypothetical protein